MKADGSEDDHNIAQRLQQGGVEAERMRHGVNPEGTDHGEVQTVLSRKASTNAKQKLVQLLEYAKRFHRLQGGDQEKTLQELEDAPGGLVLRQIQLHASETEGLHLNEDGTWLRIERVAGRMEPPGIPESLTRFIAGGRSIESPPTPKKRQADPLPQELQNEFQQYRHGDWRMWQELETKRLQGEKVYKALFTLYQQMQNEGADSPMELIWGLGMARWDQPEEHGGPIDHPIVELGVELELLPATGALVIRQKPSAKPQTRLEMFDDLNIAGLGPLRQQVLNFSDPMFKWLACSVTTFSTRMITIPLTLS